MTVTRNYLIKKIRLSTACHNKETAFALKEIQYAVTLLNLCKIV